MVRVTEQDLKDPYYFQYAFLNQKPHFKQKEVLRSKAKHKVICCGRRAGKTQMIAGEIIRGAIFNIFPKQIVIAPVYKQALIVYSKILEILRQNKLIDDLRSYPKNPYPKIEWINGSFVDFGSTDKPDSLRGEAYDRIFLDESSFIKDEAMSAIRPFTFDTDAPIWQTSTPWGKNHFYEDFRRGEKGLKGYQSFHFTSFDNPYINQERVKEEVEYYGRTSLYVRAEIYGEFIESADLYFTQELIESCIKEYPMVRKEEVYR